MLQVNVLFAYDLLTTEYDEQLLEAIITFAMSGIPCTCDGASAMVYLRLEINVASWCMSYYWKAYEILRITVKNRLKI